ncbi:META domain-containing protein [Paracoccus aerodenitrificans]|uniref:META domain-containing protein n=1 Tax=Paracoccus aerodenitrificans TaxID=3017781 RepID=UPI0022F0F9AB|nr:META domain-containing protein [Paracoccus aerodenitrificans]WBU64500.1 META domain-containing protein [Paracoccus aerodenitrificans]
MGFDGTYRLADIDGQPITGSATLMVDGSQISGMGPCNAYRSENLAEWPQIQLTAVAATKRLCLVEGGEQKYLTALAQVSEGRREAEELILSGPDHILRFTAE